MAKKTINQALRDLFIGLGGNASDLADNTSVSDYIADLESAIKAYARGSSEDLIDDTEASANKTYSSSKIETLTGSTYTKTVLYDGLTVSGQVTLSDSYKNYDALIFEVYYGEGEPSSIFSPYIPTDSDIGVRYLLDFGYNQVDDSKSKVYFEFSSNTSLNWLGDTNPIYKVIGIKF